jgi:hypothetical protein
MTAEAQVEYTTDFSEYTTGLQPSDWTQRWGTWAGNELLIVADGSALGGKYLDVTTIGASGWRALTWDKNLDAHEVEVCAKVYTGSRPDWSGYYMSPAGCVHGPSDTNKTFFIAGNWENGANDGLLVYGAADDSAINTSGLGSDLNIAAGEWWWFRGRKTLGEYRSKAWKDGDPEPYMWREVPLFDKLFTGRYPGLVGSLFNSVDVRVDWYGVATGGAEVTIPAAASGEESTLTLTTQGLYYHTDWPINLVQGSTNDAWWLRDWDEDGNDWQTKDSGILGNGVPAGAWISLKPSVLALDEMFIQTYLRCWLADIEPALLGRNWGGATSRARNGYYVYFGYTSDNYGLKKIVDGVEYNLAGPYSDLGALPSNPATIQMYLADGEQEWRFHTSSVRSSSDTDLDGTFGSAGYYMETQTGTSDMWCHDLFVCTGKNITCTNIPTGYKLKLLNAAETILATQTESSGTATINCVNTFDTPLGGFIAIVTDGSDVEQKRYQRKDGGVWPGSTLSYT